MINESIAKTCVLPKKSCLPLPIAGSFFYSPLAAPSACCFLCPCDVVDFIKMEYGANILPPLKVLTFNS